MISLKKINTHIKEFFFCAAIFFWEIEYGFFKSEILITLLLVLIINDKKQLFLYLKKVRVFYFIILHSVFIDTFFDNYFDLHSYFKIIYILFLEIIIIKYIKYISLNIEKFCLMFFVIFLSYVFFFLFDPSQNCLGCFSIYREFYTENSHLGMMAPSIMLFSTFFLIKSKNLIYGIFFFLFCIILVKNHSSTFFLGTLFSLLFLNSSILKYYKSKIFLKYLLLTFFLFTLALNSSLKNDLKERLKNNNLKNILLIIYDKKDDNDVIKYDLKKYNFNLSTEVYLKSLISSFEIFRNNIFGTGFDQYKNNNHNDIFIFKYNITSKLNNEDASQNLSKGISEFGIFYFYIFYIILKFTKNKNVSLELKNFFIPILITQLFIRGAGFFNGGFLISFLFIYHFIEKEKNLK